MAAVCARAIPATLKTEIPLTKLDFIKLLMIGDVLQTADHFDGLVELKIRLTALSSQNSAIRRDAL